MAAQQDQAQRISDIYLVGRLTVTRQMQLDLAQGLIGELEFFH
jgi:hypothetical protein